MATIEQIRGITNQAASRTKLYQELQFHPDAQLAFLGGVERTLTRVDAVLAGKYRSSRLSDAGISRAVADAEQVSGIDLTRDLRNELKPEVMGLGIGPRTLAQAINASFKNGVSMLANGFTDINQLDLQRGRATRFKKGSSTIIREGATFTPSKEGVPQTQRTGLQRNILQ